MMMIELASSTKYTARELEVITNSFGRAGAPLLQIVESATCPQGSALPSGVAMPRPPSPNATQISIRVPPAWLERADTVGAKMLRPGLAMTRADIMRMALAEGLDLIDREIWRLR